MIVLSAVPAVPELGCDKNANFVAGPLVKITSPPVRESGCTMLNVLVSERVDFKVQVETPDESEAEHEPYVLLDPVTKKVGVIPTTGTDDVSINVIVIVDVALLLATTGPVPTMLECAETGGGIKLTLPPLRVVGVTRDSVFNSTVSDFNVQVDTPR